MEIVVLVVSLLILLLNVLFGMWRGVKRSLLRLITLVLAAIAAYALTGLLSGSLAEAVAPSLEEALSSDPLLMDFVKSNPEMPALVGALSEMLVAPVLFFLCYFLLKPLTMIVYLILRALLRAGKARSASSRLGGAVMGLLIGVIGLVIFSVPLIGYSDLIVRSVDELDNSGKSVLGEIVDYNDDYIKPIANAPLAKTAYDLLGDRLFDRMTVTEWNGKPTSLEAEWFAILGVIREAQEVSQTPMAEYGEAQSQSLHKLVDHVGESRILTYLGGNTVSGMAQAWLNGETYFGVNTLELGNSNAQLLLNGILRFFATTDPTLFASDLEFFVELFDLLVKHEMFSLLGGDGGADAFVDKMVSSGFLEDIYAHISSNRRMDPIFKAVHDVGMNVLVSALGLPEQYRETYGQLMDDMVLALKDSVATNGTIDVGQLCDSLSRAFSDNGVDISAAAAEIIANGLSDEFTVDELQGGLDAEEITDRLIERFEGTESLEGLLPEGGIPEGVLPEGVLPEGVLPEGVLPEGVLPEGVLPEGALPEESLPEGQV